MLRRLAVILFLLVAGLWVAWPANPGIHLGSYDRPIEIVRGLDLQGGLRVLLEADLPEQTEVTPEQMQAARDIVEKRVNALGVSEPIVQVAGARRLVVELPGVEDTEQAVATIRETALLEFVDFSDLTLQEVEAYSLLPIATDYGLAEPPLPDPATETELPSRVFHTILTGADLENAIAVSDPAGGLGIGVDIKFNDAGAEIFTEFTAAHVGQTLAIVLDKQVVSAPTISEPITGGQARITGSRTLEEANQLAVQLRYGALPVPLRVAESKVVGPTLGQDSLQKSLQAGIIGLAIVIVFMGLYYRLPGLIASIALLFYALLTFSLFKLIPITLTLPGVAGFILSLGMAVDANVLIFERLREELREGRELRQATDLGFNRAWPSIRDSNLSTLITCGILFWFGSTFGASIVKGFALTLSIGVLVSMFTAIVVTRTLLHLVLDRLKFAEHPAWYGA